MGLFFDKEIDLVVCVGNVRIKQFGVLIMPSIEDAAVPPGFL